MARDRIPTSRVRRTATLGRLAAGQAVRQAGTRAANVTRSKEDAPGRARTPPPRGRRADRHRARDDEGRGDEARPGAVLPRRRARAGGAPRGVPGASSRSCATRRRRSRFKDMRKVIEEELDDKLGEIFADVRRGADRRRLDRAGLPRDAARRPRRGGQGPVPGRRRRGARGHAEPRPDHARRQADDARASTSRPIAEEIRERIDEELDYELEAQNQRALARIFRGHPFIVVPDVVTALSRERVLVSEFVEGDRLRASVKG